MVYLSMASLSLAVAAARAIDTYEFPDSSFQSEQLSGQRWQRPPAGWNAWFAYDKSVTQEGILRNAEALVRTGLRDAGYTYVNVDDAWAGPRAPDGTPTADNATFSWGIAALADKVHALNLSFGIYTDRASKTCGGRVASLGHEVQDANTYAKWGVDYVKEDSCGATHEHAGAFDQYQTFQAAINASGRPMFFSLCGWMRYYAAAGRKGIGQSWRVGTDCNSWDDFMLNADAAAATASFAGPGAFNDVDEIGRATCHFGKVTSGVGIDCVESKMRTQFSLIAVVGSPLLLSFDMSNWTRPWSGPTGSIDLVELYSNAEVLSVHQALTIDGQLTYSRLVGGPVTQGGVMPGTKKCDAADVTQRWRANSQGRIYSQAPGIEDWCLRQGPMGNPKPAGPSQCGHAEYVWVSACNTSCCGKQCEEYSWSPVNGTLRSGLPANPKPDGGGDPGTTLTVAPEGVPNTVMAEEQFSRSDPRALTQQVELGDDGLLRVGTTGMCMSASAPSNSSVFGRALENGHAVLLINWSRQPNVVTCDTTCMAQMGYTDVVTVRDLWAHTDNSTARTLSFTIAGDSSVFVKIAAAGDG